MPLNLADINTDYIIQKICGNEGDRHYLETLGFIEGATVRIVSILLGSYIVRIQESKIGISQDFTKVKTTRLAGGLLCPYKGLFPACARKAH